MDKINLKDYVEFSKEKYVSKILYDCDKVRMVLFCLEKGQEVHPHTVKPQVIMLVISGEGSLIVGNKTYAVKPDSVVVCESMEAHGIKADDRMVVLASIVPRP